MERASGLVEPFATITSGDLLLSNRAISKKILLLTGTPCSVSGCRLDTLDLVVSLLETHARQSTGKGKLSLFTFGQRVKKKLNHRASLWNIPGLRALHAWVASNAPGTTSQPNIPKSYSSNFAKVINQSHWDEEVHSCELLNCFELRTSFLVLWFGLGDDMHDMYESIRVQIRNLELLYGLCELGWKNGNVSNWKKNCKELVHFIDAKCIDMLQRS